jgi:SurA-like N-terminal domain
MRRIVFGALLLALTACSGTQTSAQSESATQAGSDVVAEIGGRKITIKELDEKWQTLDPGERARVTQLLYQNRRNALDQMLGDLLIEDAAKAAGMPVAQYLEQETKKRAQPVSDAEIQQFYDANKERTQGRTFEQLRGPITEFLRNQREQQARAQLIDELKKKRTRDVRVLLEPPRTEVKLESHDASLGPASAPVTIVEFSDYQ